MKKEYSKPFSKVVVLAKEELICTSDEVGVSPTGYALDGGGMESKKRENIDFSDDESIW